MWSGTLEDWTSEGVLLFSSNKLVTITVMLTRWLNIDLFTSQNRTTASVHLLNDPMTWTAAWVLWWITWLLHTSVSGWATAFGAFHQTFNLLAFALATNDLIDLWAVQYLFLFIAELAWEALKLWLAFTDQWSGQKVFTLVALLALWCDFSGDQLAGTSVNVHVANVREAWVEVWNGLAWSV